MEINITYRRLPDNKEPELDEKMVSFLNHSSEALGACESNNDTKRLYHYLKKENKCFIISDRSFFDIHKKQKDVDILLRDIDRAIRLLSDSKIISIKYDGAIEEIDNSSNSGRVKLKTKDTTIIVQSRSLW